MIRALVLAVLLAACSPGGGGDNQGASSERCDRASVALVTALETGLTVNGGGSLVNAYIVRSNDFEKVYFVAARIEGQGMGDAVGVWATNRADGTAGFFAAEAFAREFSDWGDGPGFNLSDDGLAEARDCAGT